MTDSPVIVALDVSTAAELDGLLERLPPALCRVKIGKELFTSLGPEAVQRCHRTGHQVFLDLKFHDIPNTCAMAVRAAARLGVWMVNVHASGGAQMMRAASAILQEEAQAVVPKLIAVTVLTSMDRLQLEQVGVTDPLPAQVQRLASLAAEQGLDGVVCSAEEAVQLREAFGSGFCLVTPGIRPAWSVSDDQVRVVTPREAINNGSDYLVIGRPVTRAASPSQALERILAEL